MSSDDKKDDLLPAGHYEQATLPHLGASVADDNALTPRAAAQQIADKAATDLVDIVLNRVEEDDIMGVSAACMSLRSPTGWRIAGILFVMGLNQAGTGIDWTIIGSINSYKTWHDYFNFPNDGPILATFNALMSIGYIVGAPFLVLADVWGRRSINAIGCVFIIMAAIMQSQSPNVPTFMVGRFFLGFGMSLCNSIQYVAEISPVHLRGLLVGLLGACFQVGAVGMAGAMVGFSRWDTSNWQWKTPLLLQAVPAVLVIMTMYLLCPETPRYMMMKGRPDEARRTIAKYMTSNNDINAPIVPLMIRQIEESLASGPTGIRSLKVAWDFRVFFTKRVGYRTFILLLYSLFQSWNGGGIISTYLSPALDTIGITGALQQTGINLGLTATYLVFTVLGSYLIDKMRRRTLLYCGLISCVLTQSAVTITSWKYSQNPSVGLGALTVAWVFIFQMLSASFIATMHNVYPVEILSLPLRAKGLGLYNQFQNAASIVQTYGISVGISKIGYKIWVLYIGYNAIQLVLTKFFFPETSKLSLEDIDHIFETSGQHPVAMSMKIEEGRKKRQRDAGE